MTQCDRCCRRRIFTAEFPAHIHQLDEIESAVTTPGRRSRMSAFSRKLILNGSESILGAAAPGHVQVIADTSKQNNVDAFERPPRTKQMKIGGMRIRV
jgi:hypothetical protein